MCNKKQLGDCFSTELLLTFSRHILSAFTFANMSEEAAEEQSVNLPNLPPPAFVLASLLGGHVPGYDPEIRKYII